MRIFFGLVAALLLGGCVDHERPARKQLPGEVSHSNNSKRKSAEDYATQTNKNAIKGEDFPENQAPDAGGRTGK